MKNYIILQILILTTFLSVFQCYENVVTIKVIEPKDLRNMEFQDGDFTLANYGSVPYGKSIVGKVVLSNPDTACSSLQLQSEIQPILLIKRGECKFIEKTYQASLVNTKLVIIYDTVEENENEIVMVGEQDLVKIPSIMVKKKFGDKLVQAVQNSNLVIEVYFKPIQQKKVTQIDFWLDTSDEESLKFFNFMSTNDYWSDLLKSKNVAFRPRYAIWYCGKCFATNFDITDNVKCISQGRYCHPDPDENMFINGPLQGKDAVLESLRQICIFNEYGYKDNINLAGSKWLQYMKKYLNKCVEEPRQINYKNLNQDYLEKCSFNIMKNIGISKKTIENCVEKSYADSSNKDSSNNTLLNAEQSQFVEEGIQIWPTLFINNVTYKGDLFSNTSALQVCQSLTQDSRPKFCSSQKNPVVINKSMSTGTVVLIIIFISIVLMAVGFIFYRRMLKRDMQAEMQLQVNSAISQYFALQEQKSKK